MAVINVYSVTIPGLGRARESVGQRLLLCLQTSWPVRPSGPRKMEEKTPAKEPIVGLMPERGKSGAINALSDKLDRCYATMAI